MEIALSWDNINYTLLFFFFFKNFLGRMVHLSARGTDASVKEAKNNK